MRFNVIEAQYEGYCNMLYDSEISCPLNRVFGISFGVETGDMLERFCTGTK